jgi:hypothetical protein
MKFSDINTCMLDYDYDTAYGFLSVACKIPRPEKVTPTNFIKFQVYEHTFPEVTPREKYTGFEFVTELDRVARAKISDSGLIDPVTPESKFRSDVSRQVPQKYEQTHDILTNVMKFDSDHNIESLSDSVATYRSILIANALTHRGQPNVLYYSGGADSEMVLCSFMAAGVDFVAVTFVYTTDSGEIINQHDTQRADEFCQKHNLAHVKRELNIEKFWQSSELLTYATKAENSSPQIAAYYKMLDMVHSEIEDTSFAEFAGRPYLEFGKIAIPNFPILTNSDFTELAPDIWGIKLFTESQCDDILSVITQADFATQGLGDQLPVQELLMPEFDPVFYQALKKYLELYVERFYYHTYHNSHFELLTAWFNRLGEAVTATGATNIETDQIRLHHDKSRLTLSLVLNSDFEGGEICFPRQNFTNKDIPRGTMLIWPGQITHPHAVKPVTSGTRHTMIVLTKLESFSTRELQINPQTDK